MKGHTASNPALFKMPPFQPASKEQDYGLWTEDKWGIGHLTFFPETHKSGSPSTLKLLFVSDSLFFIALSLHSTGCSALNPCLSSLPHSLHERQLVRLWGLSLSTPSWRFVAPPIVSDSMLLLNLVSLVFTFLETGLSSCRELDEKVDATRISVQ